MIDSEGKKRNVEVGTRKILGNSWAKGFVGGSHGPGQALLTRAHALGSDLQCRSLWQSSDYKAAPIRLPVQI